MVRDTVGIIAVPSSAGAFSPGQECAPGVLREGGLESLLRERGIEPGRWLEVDGFTWRPDRDSRRAQHVEEVRRVAVQTAGRVEGLLGAGKGALVLGGDCTVGIGSVAGALGAGRRAALVYLDRHADLNTPQSVRDGALDWMGMSQILDARGSIEAITAAFPTRPLLAPSRVVVLGAEEGAWTSWERGESERLGLPRIAIGALAEDPEAAAVRALELLDPGFDTLLVHFDVDLLDFIDAPFSENVDNRNSGPSLAEAARALGVLCAEERFAALTVTEANPAHSSSDDPRLERLAAVIADAWGRTAEPSG